MLELPAAKENKFCFHHQEHVFVSVTYVRCPAFAFSLFCCVIWKQAKQEHSQREMFSSCNPAAGRKPDLASQRGKSSKHRLQKFAKTKQRRKGKFLPLTDTLSIKRLPEFAQSELKKKDRFSLSFSLYLVCVCPTLIHEAHCTISFVEQTKSEKRRVFTFSESKFFFLCSECG